MSAASSSPGNRSREDSARPPRPDRYGGQRNESETAVRGRGRGRGRAGGQVARGRGDASRGRGGRGRGRGRSPSPRGDRGDRDRGGARGAARGGDRGGRGGRGGRGRGEDKDGAAREVGRSSSDAFTPWPEVSAFVLLDLSSVDAPISSPYLHRLLTGSLSPSTGVVVLHKPKQTVFCGGCGIQLVFSFKGADRRKFLAATRTNSSKYMLGCLAGSIAASFLAQGQLYVLSADPTLCVLQDSLKAIHENCQVQTRPEEWNLPDSLFDAAEVTPVYAAGDDSAHSQPQDDVPLVVGRVRAWIHKQQSSGAVLPASLDSLLKAIGPFCKVKHASQASTVYELLRQRGLLNICGICVGLSFSPSFRSGSFELPKSTAVSEAVVVRKLQTHLANAPAPPTTPLALVKLLETYKFTSTVDPRRVWQELEKEGSPIQLEPASSVHPDEEAAVNE